MTKYSAEIEVEIAKAITYYLKTLRIKKLKVVAKFLILYRLFIKCLKARLV